MAYLAYTVQTEHI